MGKGPKYQVRFKRRRNMKTNYRIRKAMILSRETRLVARCTANHATAQLVKSYSQGDNTLIYVNSQELRKFGWKLPCGNLPSAYLVGLLLGYKSIANNQNNAIFDIGTRIPSKASRVFGILKGALDAGMIINSGEGILPGEDRLSGEHIASYAKKLNEVDPEIYRKRFTRYLKVDIQPEEIKKFFNQVKKNIIENFKEVKIIGRTDGSKEMGA